MGRKKKIMSELSKKSLQMLKSKFKKRIEKVNHSNVTSNSHLFQEKKKVNLIQLENEVSSDEVSSDETNSLGVVNEIEIDSVGCDKFNDMKSIRNSCDYAMTEGIKNCIRENAIKFNLQRSCVTKMLKGFGNYIPNLPKDYRSLLKTPRKTRIRKIKKGLYTHFDMLNTLQLLCKTNPESNVLICDFFVDGVAFFADTRQKSFWVILGRCQGKIFPIGFYHGQKQPQCFNDLLKDLVSDLKLLRGGVLINNFPYTLKVRHFCLDTPAKAHVTQTIHANGYNSCPYCYIEGFYMNGHMIFDEVNHERRTDEEFKEQIDARHHKGKSILETELDLDMIHNFPADALFTMFIMLFTSAFSKNR